MTPYQNMQHLQDSITALEVSFHALEWQRDEYRARLEEIEGECASMAQTLAGLRRRMDLAAGQTKDVDLIAARDLPDVDLEGCKNTGERMVRIACAMGGILDARDAVEMMLRTGISRAKSDNLRSKIQREAAHNQGDWEYLSPRTYRYLHYQGDAAGGDTEEDPGDD